MLICFRYSHDTFHQIFFESVRLSVSPWFLRSAVRSTRAVTRRLVHCLNLLWVLLFVKAFQSILFLWMPWSERADGNSSGSCQQGKADIIAAQAEGTGGRLVVFDGQYRNLRFPVGGDRQTCGVFSMMVRALSASSCRTAGSDQDCASMGYFLNIRLYTFNLMYRPDRLGRGKLGFHLYVAKVSGEVKSIISSPYESDGLATLRTRLSRPGVPPMEVVTWVISLRPFR